MMTAAIVLPAVLIAFLLMVLRRSFRRVRKGFSDSARELISAKPRTRWVIGGMMGSGKTTFARRLAAALQVPDIEIDLHPSEDDLLHRVGACPQGWVAEANPWQIPQRLVAQAEAIVFLDYDNVVNYARLLKRGWQEWTAQRFSAAGFKATIVDKAVLDLGRIVYRHGRSNRERWRQNGLFAGLDPATVACFHCVSPAELEILARFVIEGEADGAARRPEPSR